MSCVGIHRGMIIGLIERVVVTWSIRDRGKGSCEDWSMLLHEGQLISPGNLSSVFALKLMA